MLAVQVGGSMKSIILIVLAGGAALFGQETVLEFDPAQTHVQFTLSDVLHTVHGSFKLKQGTVRYNFATGKCSGAIVIDAQSGDSGSEARDKRMHKNILESDRYPDIIFIPDHVEGKLSKASIHGAFRIHGKDHEMTILVEAVPTGNRLDITTQFIVPYVEWGMKNPSTFFLRVGSKVNIDVHALGKVRVGSTGAAAYRRTPGRNSRSRLVAACPAIVTPTFSATLPPPCQLGGDQASDPPAAATIPTSPEIEMDVRPLSRRAVTEDASACPTRAHTLELRAAK